MVFNGVTDWLLGLLGAIGMGFVGYIHNRVSSLRKTVERHETSIAVVTARLEGMDEKLDENVDRLTVVQDSVNRVALAVARIEGRLNG